MRRGGPGGAGTTVIVPALVMFPTFPSKRTDEGSDEAAMDQTLPPFATGSAKAYRYAGYSEAPESDYTQPREGMPARRGRSPRSHRRRKEDDGVWRTSCLEARSYSWLPMRALSRSN